MRITSLVSSLAMAACLTLGATVAAAERPRLIVTTDIGGDPDDQQAMVRLMLYANEFDIEALIASSAGVPGQLPTPIIRPDIIRDVIGAYGQVQPNLRLHDPAYPEAQALLDRVYAGNPNRGTAYIGAAHDTDGSRRIIAVADAADSRPVNIAIWGGQTDLAQALWRVRNDRGAAGLAACIAKLRIHDISNQDNILGWMQQQFPGMWYILSKSTTASDKTLAVYRGMYLGGDASITSRAWLDANVRVGHGPLGPKYPNAGWTAPNPHNGLKEGDTPSWFYFLARGLNDPAQPGWGGWGGRFATASGTFYRDATDTVAGVTGARETVNRWRPRFQAELQARMDWCVQPVAAANHAPVATVNGIAGTAVVQVQGVAGSELELSAAASDRDGQPVSYRWWQYREPSTCAAAVTIANATVATARVAIPADAQPGTTIHIVLEVTDTGVPALTACRRVVITVAPPPLGAAIRINFQPTAAPVPAGFAKDDGSMFSTARGYGWDIDRRSSTRDRGRNADQSLDTQISGGSSTAYATWEQVLPNGRYLVSVAMGDALAVQGPQRIEAEGVRLVNDVVTAVNTFATASDMPVTVADGRLTLRMGCVGSTLTSPDGSTDSTLNWIIITPAPLVAAQPVRINFQPAAAAPVSGWAVDAGAVYGDRGNGQAYGWKLGNAANSRERNSAQAPDQLHDTLNHLQKTAGQSWELAVANGTYSVRVVCGDPGYTDQINALAIEGVVVADPDGEDRFDEHEVTITVADGRLTIAPGPGALNAKLCCIEAVAQPTGNG